MLGGPSFCAMSTTLWNDSVKAQLIKIGWCHLMVATTSQKVIDRPEQQPIVLEQKPSDQSPGSCAQNMKGTPSGTSGPWSLGKSIKPIHTGAIPGAVGDGHPNAIRPLLPTLTCSVRSRSNTRDEHWMFKSQNKDRLHSRCLFHISGW